MPPSDSQGLDIRRLVKTFDGLVAVDEVSFEVEPGTIFGLLGPNGAGKTTIIRIIMGILGADEGDVRYQGHPITCLSHREPSGESRRFGYLPEERGLYQKTRLRETLIYLARLKGLAPAEAAGRVDAYLERFELQDYARKNIQALSKGNQQKAQFIAAIVHQPSVVILDEPFVGLDPVNQLILKEIISEFQTGGATILLSTHQMDQVERLCDAICLINRGRVVLEGSLAEVKASRGEQCVEVAFDGIIPEGLHHWLSVLEIKDRKVVGNLKRGLAPTLKGLIDLGQVLEFKVREPTLEEIFITVVKEAEA
ncbi:MAG: ATP-binding cassette domain-containing protein [Calditrichaeota bacterium]|nr:ATP-binding cassette domain-containing protein [Calditrichota bacterium]